MAEPRTTIDYKGKTYPFYKTNRGQYDFENAGFTTEDILKGKTGAMLAMLFFNLRDCAKRAGTPIEDSFEQFIDESEPDIINAFMRLKEEREKGEGKTDKGKKEKTKTA